MGKCRAVHDKAGRENNGIYKGATSTAPKSAWNTQKRAGGQDHFCEQLAKIQSPF